MANQQVEDALQSHLNKRGWGRAKRRGTCKTYQVEKKKCQIIIKVLKKSSTTSTLCWSMTFSFNSTDILVHKVVYIQTFEEVTGLLANVW